MSLTKTHGFSVSWPFRDCQGCRSYATIKGIQLSCINTLIHLALGGNRFKVSQLKRSQISCKQSVYSSKFSTSVCIVFFLIYFQHQESIITQQKDIAYPLHNNQAGLNVHEESPFLYTMLRVQGTQFSKELRRKEWI